MYEVTRKDTPWRRIGVVQLSRPDLVQGLPETKCTVANGEFWRDFEAILLAQADEHFFPNWRNSLEAAETDKFGFMLAGLIV
ncbi:MAG: hypothetical protein R3C97_00600 [Geminicoccaceae bacterium]